jgi:hypothetical protein
MFIAENVTRDSTIRPLGGEGIPNASAYICARFNLNREATPNKMPVAFPRVSSSLHEEFT